METTAGWSAVWWGREGKAAIATEVVLPEVSL